jgi:hypothetical protein
VHRVCSVPFEVLTHPYTLTLILTQSLTLSSVLSLISRCTSPTHPLLPIPLPVPPLRTPHLLLTTAHLDYYPAHVPPPPLQRVPGTKRHRDHSLHGNDQPPLRQVN